MSPRHIAIVLLVLLLANGSHLCAQSLTAKCGFSVTVPPSWKLTRVPNRDPRCWFAVESLRKKEACSLQLRTLDQDFETAAKDAGFKKQEGKWVLPPSYPLGETMDAEEISGEHWRGIEAENVDRATQVGGSVDTSMVKTVVINDGEKRSAVIEGFDCPDKRFDSFVQSFRFISK